MKVRAKGDDPTRVAGYIDNARIREGQVFNIDDRLVELKDGVIVKPTWVEMVGGKKAAPAGAKPLNIPGMKPKAPVVNRGAKPKPAAPADETADEETGDEPAKPTSDRPADENVI